ncbi:MAG TPA: polysaccharide deacetylase, partial [Saliniramus sp.]|nr:polysaccharide deacetylase [Saliniramus sp.]
RSQDMVDYVTDALATLLAEADAGKPRLLNCGFHLRIVGRPARLPARPGILGALDAHRHRIWIARRSEIADAFARAIRAQAS